MRGGGGVVLRPLRGDLGDGVGLRRDGELRDVARGLARVVAGHAADDLAEGVVFRRALGELARPSERFLRVLARPLSRDLRERAALVLAGFRVGLHPVIGGGTRVVLRPLIDDAALGVALGVVGGKALNPGERAADVVARPIAGDAADGVVAGVAGGEGEDVLRGGLRVGAGPVRGDVLDGLIALLAGWELIDDGECALHVTIGEGVHDAAERAVALLAGGQREDVGAGGLRVEGCPSAERVADGGVARAGVGDLARPLERGLRIRLRPARGGGGDGAVAVLAFGQVERVARGGGGVLRSPFAEDVVVGVVGHPILGHRVDHLDGSERIALRERRGEAEDRAGALLAGWERLHPLAGGARVGGDPCAEGGATRGVAVGAVGEGEGKLSCGLRIGLGPFGDEDRKQGLAFAGREALRHGECARDFAGAHLCDGVVEVVQSAHFIRLAQCGAQRHLSLLFLLGAGTREFLGSDDGVCGGELECGVIEGRHGSGGRRDGGGMAAHHESGDPAAEHECGCEEPFEFVVHGRLGWGRGINHR